MRELFIIRGLPGSGKSTLVELICGRANTFSADDFFYDGGDYKYDGAKIKDAHYDCMKRVSRAMLQLTEMIAICNTFTREWEFTDYENLANMHGYRIHYIIIENRHKGKSSHGVPLSVIDKMKERFEIKL